MEFFTKLFDLLRHLGEDDKWRAMVDFVGIHNLYLVLFAIVFCETGLVVTPFLPGDSLIFSIGAVAGREIGINLLLVGPLLLAAALIGDNVNYWLGRRLGPAVFKREDSRLLNKKHLINAQGFYEKYGSKTVILARFVPIIRTFAPFVAGIGRMNYARFLIFSVIGAVAWVSLCLGAGYALGSRPFFKKHFELVVLVIVFVSVIPVIVEFLKARRASKNGKDALLEATTLGEKTD
ncbi:MAG TPA: VTT domain-containing protein [Tepidisphaeraceae bacterium]|nr:VTT domain-containing protein [Tepidisphaeraceae bacterium]